MARADHRSDAVRYPRELEIVVDRIGGAVRRLVRDVPAQPGHRPGQERDLRRLIARLAEIAALGFDVVYLVPIHPIGRINRKGKDNSTVAAPGRSRQPLRDRRRGGRPHGGASRARHARRFPPLCRAPPPSSAWRSRSISRSSAPPTTPGCASTGSGSSSAPTARSNTPRTRRRNTRTSSMSISTTPTARGCGTNCAISCCSGSTRGCAPSASTTRTPSRCRSGNG